MVPWGFFQILLPFPYPHPYQPSICELAWQPLQDFCSDQQFSGEPEALLAPRLCHRISFRLLSIATASSHISCASSTFKLSELLCPIVIIEKGSQFFIQDDEMKNTYVD